MPLLTEQVSLLAPHLYGVHRQLLGVQVAVAVGVGGAPKPRKVAVALQGALDIHVTRGRLGALHAAGVHATLCTAQHSTAHGVEAAGKVVGQGGRGEQGPDAAWEGNSR